MHTPTSTPAPTSSSSSTSLTTSSTWDETDDTVAVKLTEVEEAEQNTVQGLLSLLEDTSVASNASNDSSGVLGYIFAEEEEAAVHAWALNSPSASDTPLTSALTLDANTVGLAVPLESLAQVAELAAAAGGEQEVVLLTISTFQATSALNVSQQALVVDPVRVNFRTAGGQRLRVQALRQPLELRFQHVAAGEGGRQFQCAFWDEENSRWSRDGVQRSEDMEEFVCLANHLTLFGVVLDAVAQAFRCSTASDVLSAASFQNMSRTQWLAYPASIFSFVFLGICLAAMLWGLHLDRKAARALPESDVEAVLLVNRAEKKVTWEPDWQKHRHSAFCCWCLAKACDGFAWLVSTIFEFQATDSLAEFTKPQEATVSRCIALLHSQKAGADRKSISAVLTSSGERKLRRRGASESPHSMQGEQSTTSKASQATAMVQSWDVHTHGVWAVNRYLSASWCRRVMILLPCLHPWVRLALLSLFKSHTMRAALVVLKLSTSAFANALFFTTAAQTADSDDECAAQESLGQKLLTATVVGISSACMSDVLVICLALLQRRRVLIRDLWTEEMKVRQVRRWRLRRRLFWCVWTLAFVFSILYILSFLANVSEADAAKWLESSGVSFLQDLLLKPALMAMGYATLTTFVLCCSPRVKDAILNQWIQADEDVDESVAEDTVSLSFPAGDSIGVDETESDHEELVQTTFLGDSAGLDETEGREEQDSEHDIGDVSPAATAKQLQATQGSVTGRLLPSGQLLDQLSIPGSSGELIEATLLDAGQPMVFLRAADLFKDRLEVAAATPQAQAEVLKTDTQLLRRVECIRGVAAVKMGIVQSWEEAEKVSPYTPFVAAISAAPSKDADFTSVCVFMQKVHQAYPVTGSVATAAAALLEGSIVHAASQQHGASESGEDEKHALVRIAHPSGVMDVHAAVRTGTEPSLLKAALRRTARCLMDGQAYVPWSVWPAD
eukprot:s2424_g6.t1